jgi:virginiamycin B lyase
MVALLLIAVAIQEFNVPTADSRPHDPAVAPDGALWFTEQKANKLGRLDPRTGTIREFPLPVPDSGPHGLAVDRDGSVWFTANYKGYVGKLDPKTGDVRQFQVGGDPHTPVIDGSGIVWFTEQEANQVGRLDPKTGHVDRRRVPTRDAKPYGMVATPEGLFFCEFGSNKLGRIDPATLRITEYELPDGARPRRLALAPDGTIYYSDFARGYLGRFDPRAGKFLGESPSPGGPHSKPYGIAVTADGIVWFSESGVQPNTLVRFDPRTSSFSRTPIPSGGGVVRNMVSTPEGALYLACSGVNKVAIAR